MYRLTSDRKYLEYADKTLINAISRYANDKNAIFTEVGEGDGGLFKGIFVRYATILAKLLPERSALIKKWLTINANSIIENALNKDGLISDNWSGPAKERQNLSTHLSGVMLFESCVEIFNDNLSSAEYQVIKISK